MSHRRSKQIAPHPVPIILIARASLLLSFDSTSTATVNKIPNPGKAASPHSKVSKNNLLFCVGIRIIMGIKSAYCERVHTHFIYLFFSNTILQYVFF